MSISDEDTTSTTSKRSAKSPPRKIRHRNPQNDQEEAKPPPNNDEDLKTIPLTKEQVVEYVQCQVGEVLNQEQYWKRNDIVVIPSLVSLSTDFFTGDASVGGVDVDTSSSAAAGSLDFPSSFPTLKSGSDPFVSSLQPRQKNNTSQLGISLESGSFGVVGGEINTSIDNELQSRRRPVTPPIGPQGAPIPRHVLNQQGIGNAFESVARGNNNNQTFINNVEMLQEPSSPNARHVFSNNYQNASLQLSAPARLGQHIQQQSNSQGETKYINVVESLAEAVARMERRLEEGAAANTSMDTSAFRAGGEPHTPSRQPPSTPRRHLPSTPVPSTPKQSSLYKDNIDELESETITQLAEIMLHPPVGKVVKCGDEEEIVRYVWEDGPNDSCTDEPKSDLQMSDISMEDESKSKSLSINTSWHAKPTSATSISTKSRYTTSKSAHAYVAMLGLSIPRRVCQHPFRRNDIVWYVGELLFARRSVVQHYILIICYKGYAGHVKVTRLVFYVMIALRTATTKDMMWHFIMPKLEDVVIVVVRNDGVTTTIFGSTSF